MKNRQQGSATYAILAVVALLVVVFFVYVYGNNKANAMEQTLKAESQNRESVLANYGQKIQEAAQVPGMATADIVAISKAAIQGRYGENGSQAAVQMIREQNPQVDPKLYSRLQQIIEAGRDEFQVKQARLVDVKRVYETELGSAVTGAMMHFAGYPKINLEDPKFQIVSTGRAQSAVATGREEGPIQLRPAQPAH